MIYSKVVNINLQLFAWRGFEQKGCENFKKGR